MRITEARLRTIIREELLREAVKDTHGYRISSIEDVKWSPDKRDIPRDKNPFVSGSPAFESWYNDGDPTTAFMVTSMAGTPDEIKKRIIQDILFKEGEFVIIPTLWDSFPMVGEIMTIHSEDASGVPDSLPSDSIPLVDVRFEVPGKPNRWAMNVGLAFLRRVAGKRGRDDAYNEAMAAMAQHRAGPPPSKSPRRVAPGMDPVSDAPAAPRVLRRRPGEAPPPRQKATTDMTPDEIRAMLGISRRE